MNRSLVDVLADPTTGDGLTVEPTAIDPVLEGWLVGPARQYPITGGIPRLVPGVDEDQAQTRDSFGFKWHQVDTYDSPGMRTWAAGWLSERYGFLDSGQMGDYLAGRRRILDIGCGSGYSTSLWMSPAWRGEWIGADISTAIDVAQQRLGDRTGTAFVQADALRLPFREGSFDTVIAEGVFHHTPSPKAALMEAVRVLEDGGELMFYVYRRKAPIREFADDQIRDQLASLTPEEAWDALRPLTALARSLSDLRATIDIPEDIELLGIKAGQYDLQRLIYWHFAKMYWNEAFLFEENQHVNFDWYHPKLAHRQSSEEVRAWCAEAGLDVFHFDADLSGLTVRARRT